MFSSYQVYSLLEDVLILLRLFSVACAVSILFGFVAIFT